VIWLTILAAKFLMLLVVVVHQVHHGVAPAPQITLVVAVLVCNRTITIAPTNLEDGRTEEEEDGLQLESTNLEDEGLPLEKENTSEEDPLLPEKENTNEEDQHHQGEEDEDQDIKLLNHNMI
jgi:hypothetical protein